MIFINIISAANCGAGMSIINYISDGPDIMAASHERIIHDPAAFLRFLLYFLYSMNAAVCILKIVKEISVKMIIIIYVICYNTY